MVVEVCPISIEYIKMNNFLIELINHNVTVNNIFLVFFFEIYEFLIKTESGESVALLTKDINRMETA